MAAMNTCVWTKFTLSLIFSSVASCPTIINVYTSGSAATLQYDVNSLSFSNTQLTYQVIDPGGTVRAQFLMKSGQITSTVQVARMTFTGSASTGEMSFRIDNVQIRDAGVYKMVSVPDTDTPLLCNTVYITGSLSVPTLTPNKSPSVGESVTLTCSSSSTTVPAGIPLAYTWQVDGATNPAYHRYTYSTTRETLTVSDVEKLDADKVFTCMAQEEGSQITSSSSSQFRINVLYAPTITITKTPSDVTECTDRLMLTCNVSSNPVSSIMWNSGDQNLSSTGNNNVGQYSVTTIDRTLTGQYSCDANNGYGGSVQETVAVSVKYAPDVSVTTRNITTQDQSVDIVCNPSGVPDQYTFSPWTHQWDINAPLLNHPGLGNRPVLRLTNLTYEHSGVYTCTVNNGVDCSRNADAGSGQVNIVVKAAPVLIYPQLNSNTKRIRLAAEVNQLAVFTFTFWSNADTTAVTCYRNINGTRQNLPVGNTVFTQTTVILPVFSTPIATTGTLARLSLNIGDEEDLGAYDVVLSNQIGEGKLLAIDVVKQDKTTLGGSQINVGVVAGSIVGAIVALIIVGIGIFLYRRVECTWKVKSRKKVDDVLKLNERPNVYETPNQDAGPGHVYADLIDQPMSSKSTGQESGSNVYEKPVSISKEEHVYTDLQQT